MHNVYNKSDRYISSFNIKSTAIGFSSSGGVSPTQAMGMGMAASLLGNVNKNDSSTTQSAVSDSINLEVRNGETPTALSRNTETANQKVKAFDKAEYQERQEAAQVIGEIAKNGIAIATYEDRMQSAKLKDRAKDAEKAKDDVKAKSLFEQAAVIDKRIDDKFGIGSSNGQAIAAVTAVLQGLAAGNEGQAIVGGLSPYVNQQIKDITGDNTEANIIAHALWGAIEAQAAGNNALAGVAGAASGEIAAKVLSEQLYGKEAKDLTAGEKETISALSQVVGALSAVAVADSSADAYRGAEVAKSAVENNYLHAKQITTWLDKYAEVSSDKERAELVKIANSVDKEQRQKAFNTLISKKYFEKQKSELVTLLNSNSCNNDCKRIAQYSIEQLNPIIENYSELQRGNNIPRAAVATITLAIPALSKPLAPYASRWMGSTTLTNRVTGAGISGLANLGMQGYNIYENSNTEFNFTSFGTSLATGTITPGMGYWGTTITNTIGAGFSSMIDGQSPWISMGGAFVGSTVGYGGAKWITNTLDNKFNPWSRGLKDRPFAVMPSMTAPPSVSPMPGIIGNSFGSVGSEYLNRETIEVLKKITTGNGNESN